MDKAIKTVIIVIVCLSIGIGIKIYLESKKDDTDDVKIAMLKYFSETDETTTSVWSLVENGYYDNLSNKCDIITYDKTAKNVVNAGKNCDKAKEYSKYPAIRIDTTNDLILNRWNTKPGTISYSLVNGGNSTYKTNDITKSILKNNTTGEEIESFSSLEILYYSINYDYTLIVEFKNGEYKYTKDFSIKIDAAAPHYVRSVFNKNELTAYYADLNEYKVLYYVSESSNKPNIYNLKEKVNTDYECDKTYHAWSIAIDTLGNTSEIEYIGEYHYSCN